MFEELLNKEGSQLVSKIQSNIQSAGKNATGKTARSLKTTVIDNDKVTKLTIDAAPWFFTLETGRKAGKRPPIAPIMEWIQAKGIQGGKGLAYAIAVNIGKKGTKLFQTGGRKDIFSNVINDNTVKRIEDKIAEISIKATADSIIERYEKRN